MSLVLRAFSVSEEHKEFNENKQTKSQNQQTRAQPPARPAGSVSDEYLSSSKG